MKTLFQWVLGMGALLLLTACETSNENEVYDAVYLKNKASNNELASEMKTLGFNVTLYGTYEYQGPDMSGEKCGLFEDTGLVLVRNTGVGNGTHFKKVRSFFEFCVRPVAGGGGTYPEGYIDAYFEDEDGDLLFLEVAGQVFPGRLPGMPSFALSYFKDPFTITGGTGKFEGASGDGFTNDYNYRANDGMVHTSHHWQGTITMKKGKK